MTVPTIPCGVLMVGTALCAFAHPATPKRRIRNLDIAARTRRMGRAQAKPIGIMRRGVGQPRPDRCLDGGVAALNANERDAPCKGSNIKAFSCC